VTAWQRNRKPPVDASQPEMNASTLRQRMLADLRGLIAYQSPQ
jgi:hypothetical protein